MLGVICGLMVMGCPTEDKDEVKETIPKQYQGTFSNTTNNTTNYVTFTKNQIVSPNSDFKWDVWAEGNEIFGNVANNNFPPYNESGTRKHKWAVFSTIDSVTIFSLSLDDVNGLQYTRVHD